MCQIGLGLVVGVDNPPILARRAVLVSLASSI